MSNRANPAKAYLSRYRHLSAKAEALEDAIRRLREQAEKITTSLSPDKLTGGPERDKIGDAAAAIADAEKKLLEIRTEAVRAMVDISGAVRAVADDRMQTVLFLRYIEGLRWEDVALALRLDVRQVYRIHGEALREIKISEMQKMS